MEIINSILKLLEAYKLIMYLIINYYWTLNTNAIIYLKSFNSVGAWYLLNNTLNYICFAGYAIYLP